MKKILVLMLVLSLALLFVGCGDDKDDDKVTQISFKNTTNGEITIMIDGTENTLVAGETNGYTFDNNIFVNDQNQIIVNYNVMGIFVAPANMERTVTINKGKTTQTEILADGGVISLRNDYYFAIEDIRIYTGTSTGNNLISQPLATGETIFVLKDPATYTISVRLETDEMEFMSDVVVTDNNLTPVIYDKKVFALENKTASAITYKLDNEATNTVAVNGIVNRELGEGFGAMVDFNYNGLYLFAETLTLDYEAQSYYAFEMNAQGGAIFVVNNTSDNITGVYITQSATNWGPDYMAGSITPGSNFAWTVQEGLWNVKIVDDAGYASEVMNITVHLNQSEYVDYGDKRVKSNPNNIQIETNYIPVNGARVEAN